MKIIGSLLAISLAVLLSCTKEDGENQEQGVNNGPFIYKKVYNSSYKRKILDWNLSEYGSIRPLKSTLDVEVDFNYDSLTIASMQGDQGHVIVANQLDYNAAETTNFGIGYFEHNNEIIGALVVRLERISDDILAISYCSLESNDMVTLEIDTKNQTSTILTQFCPNGTKSTDQLQGWGKNTMDCLADAYGNHGALSVWAFVQTAFIPATAAALAVACGIKNI
jgi:hypothetical protein